MTHVTLPHQWLSFLETNLGDWTATVQQFRVTLNEISLMDSLELVRIPQDKTAKDVVVFLDHTHKLRYDVGQSLLITNVETGEYSIIDVEYRIDNFNFGSYALKEATDRYDVEALRAIAATKEVGDRDVINPLPVDDDLEF